MEAPIKEKMRRPGNFLLLIRILSGVKKSAKERSVRDGVYSRGGLDR